MKVLGAVVLGLVLSVSGCAHTADQTVHRHDPPSVVWAKTRAAEANANTAHSN